MHKPHNTQYELAISLTLDLNGKEIEIPAGNIEKWSCALHSHGFSSSVEFSSFDQDELDDLLSSPKVIKAKMVCASLASKQGSSQSLSAALTKLKNLPLKSLFELKGIVTKKFCKRIDELEEMDKPTRLYEIFFEDALQVIWKEHFPINLYINKSMKEIIELQKDPEIVLEYSFPPLEESQPMTAFSLGGQTSFYSLIHWYLNQMGGVLIYDYKENRYSISKEKKNIASSLELTMLDVLPPACLFPKDARASKRVLNHSCLQINEIDTEEENAFQFVREDSIDPEIYRQFPEMAQEKKLSSSCYTHPLLTVEIKELSDRFHLDQVMPNTVLKFKKIKGWTEDALYQKGNFRVETLWLNFFKLSQSDEVYKPTANYQLGAQFTLEAEEEKYVAAPPVEAPRFPFYLQGTISSKLGEKEQSTYQLALDEKTSQSSYLVSIPLAKEENKIEIPFTPDFMSGQYYFPLCKGEKVLVALYFHTAKIVRILDWQPLARLPTDVQGNQIVFSSEGVDKYAILKHEFEDKTKPVVTLQLSTSDTQKHTVILKDQEIHIVIEERDKKNLLFCLHKEKGITVSLKDQSSNTQQTILLDGETITHTCKNDSDTTTVVQKPDSIDITCKNFSINADVIKLNAKDILEQTGETEVNINGAIAKISTKKVTLGG